MKKAILILLILIMGIMNASFAWEPDPIKDEVENIPEYKEYFEEYSRRLRDNFQPEKHFIGVGIGTYDTFMYTIFRDGTVKNIQDDWLHKGRYFEYCKKVIENTKPKPFPDAIKDDFIIMDVTLGYYNENEFDLLVFKRRTKSNLYTYWQPLYSVRSVQVVSIDIIKKDYWHKLFK